jgi:hypothetical protein
MTNPITYRIYGSDILCPKCEQAAILAVRKTEFAQLRLACHRGHCFEFDLVERQHHEGEAFRLGLETAVESQAEAPACPECDSTTFEIEVVKYVEGAWVTFSCRDSHHWLITALYSGGPEISDSRQEAA